MFKRLLDSLFQRRLRLQRQELARRVLALVERRGALPLDADTVEWLGSEWRDAFMMVCYLAVRERIHVATDREGRLTILSNAEFERRLHAPPPLLLEDGTVSGNSGNFLVAARERKVARRLPGKKIVMRVDMTADCLPVDEVEEPGVETVVMRPAIDGKVVMRPALDEKIGDAPQIPIIDPVSPIPEEGDWFNIVVSSSILAGEGEGRESPETRQSLPDRPRVPWSRSDTVSREKEK